MPSKKSRSSTAAAARCPFCGSRGISVTTSQDGYATCTCQPCGRRWDAVTDVAVTPVNVEVVPASKPTTVTAAPNGPEDAGRGAAQTQWVLTRHDGQEVRCYLAERETPPKCVLRVTFASDTLVMETFSNVNDAIYRAQALREGLIRKGWHVAGQPTGIDAPVGSSSASVF